MSSENGLVKEVANEALRMMKDAGFEIPDKLDVLVDPKLPFMGYSTKRGGSNIIVVAGEALRSGMIEGLLVHEMSPSTGRIYIIHRTIAVYWIRLGNKLDVKTI